MILAARQRMEVPKMIARHERRESGARSLRGCLLVCGALELVSIGALGCATSHIETAWIEPTATAHSFELKRVLVVALVNDGAVRRASEDALVNVLRTGPRGMSGELVAEPSYPLLSDRELS